MWLTCVGGGCGVVVMGVVDVVDLCWWWMWWACVGGGCGWLVLVVDVVMVVEW